MNPVTVNKIKVTSKTLEVTGISSYEEILSKKSKLFSAQTDKQLSETYNKIHGGKLKESDLSSFGELTKEEKRNACINALTFQLELTQKAQRDETAISTGNSLLSHFLVGRANTNGDSLKYFWQTVTFQFCQEHEIESGFNISEYYGTLKDNKKGDANYVVYLLRSNFTTIPEDELQEGLITYAPKTAGKGGDVLTFKDKLIFQKTELVMYESDNINDDIIELENKEKAASIKHDGTIDYSDVPTMQKVGALFNDEFQEWLQEEYASRNLKMNTKIAA